MSTTPRAFELYHTKFYRILVILNGVFASFNLIDFLFTRVLLSGIVGFFCLYAVIRGSCNIHNARIHYENR
jgi:hypothetical protein